MVRIYSTTTFRLALMYLALFVGSVMVILMVAYRFTAGFMEEELSDSVRVELAAIKERYDRLGIDGVVEVVGERSVQAHSNAVYLLQGPGGRMVVGNLSAWPTVPPDADGWIHFKVTDSTGPDGRTVTARAVGYAFPERFRLLVGRDMSDVDLLRQRMVQSLGWIVVVTGGLGLAGGSLLSRGFLRRLEAINRTARRIVAGDLSRRVPRLGGDDELDKLAVTLNVMLDRIEQLMSGMRQVSESIAHDLRTPLTRMRSRIELALIRPETKAETYREVLEDTLEEADRLLATFAALLTIAEADSGARRRDFSPVDVSALARLAVELYEPSAEEREIAFTADIADTPAVTGNAPLLSQVIANLLDNALKFTPPGGRVLLSVGGPNGAGVTLRVADSGPGIPVEERERVLQRFVRLDQSRATPGNGLGLSLVDAVARLHGARLILGDGIGTGEQPGLSVSLCLPTGAATSRQGAPNLKFN